MKKPNLSALSRIALPLLLAFSINAHAADPPPPPEAVKAVEPAKPAETAQPPQAVKPAEPAQGQTPAPAKGAEGALPAENPVKLGYVDTSKIAAESLAGKASFAELKEKKEKFQKQITAKQKQLEKQKAAIEEKLPTYTPLQREGKAKDFQKKVEEYQKLVRKAEKEMVESEEEHSRKLFKAIEKAAEEYGRDNGYGVIVIKKELLYLGSGIQAKDVTDEIIKLVDKGK